MHSCRDSDCQLPEGGRRLQITAQRFAGQRGAQVREREILCSDSMLSFNRVLIDDGQSTLDLNKLLTRLRPFPD